MPEGNGLAKWGSLAVQGISAVGSAISNSRQNKKDRKHQREMYDRQRQDNIDDWHRNNEYNDPAAQMERLKNGGLSPHLIYGQSSGGAAGSASPIAKATEQSPHFRTNDFSGVANAGTTAINQYYDIQVKKAQTDNLKADNTVKLQEALLKAAQIQDTGAATKNKQAGTAKTATETEILNNIKQYSGDGAKAAVAKQQADIESTISDTNRKNNLHASNMEQAQLNNVKTRVGNKYTTAQIRKAIAEAGLKEQELELAKEGIHKGDPLWARMLKQNEEKIIAILNKMSKKKWSLF